MKDSKPDWKSRDSRGRGGAVEKLTWEDELTRHKDDEKYLHKNCGVSPVDAKIILRIYDNRKSGRRDVSR